MAATFPPASFLGDMTRWAAGLAVVLAVGGGILTRDWRFVVACALGAAFDVASMALLLRTSSRRSSALQATQLAALLIAPRLAVKAVLLAAAAALPRLLDLWGMLAGVLVFDLTVMTVGSVKAAYGAWR